MLEFSIGNFVLSFIFSGIGFVYLTYGKKLQEMSFVFSGILLIGYTYFVDGITLNMIIGILLTLSPFILRRYL